VHCLGISQHAVPSCHSLRLSVATASPPLKHIVWNSREQVLNTKGASLNSHVAKLIWSGSREPQARTSHMLCSPTIQKSTIAPRKHRVSSGILNTYDLARARLQFGGSAAGIVSKGKGEDREPFEKEWLWVTNPGRLWATDSRMSFRRYLYDYKLVLQHCRVRCSRGGRTEVLRCRQFCCREAGKDKCGYGFLLQGPAVRLSLSYRPPV